MNNRRFTRHLLFIFVGLVFSIAASSGAAEPDDDRDEAVIVILAPLTGDLGSMGEQLVESAQLAGDDTGIAIEKVDAGESVEETLDALTELGERQDVAAIIAPLGRRQSRAAARKAQQIGVPMVVYSSVPGIERSGGWIFRGRLNAAEQSERVADYLTGDLGQERVAIMAPTSNFGDELVPALIESITEADAEMTAMARYPEDATDFLSPLRVLTGERAFVGNGRTVAGRRADRHGTIEIAREGTVAFDTLIIADFHDVVARILPFLPRVGVETGGSEEGVSVQLIGLAGWRGDSLARAGDHARGAIFFDTFGGRADGPAGREFASRFYGQTGREAATPEAEIYDLVSMIAQGLNDRDDSLSVTATTIRTLRSEQPFDGVTGEWSFDESGAPIRHLNTYHVIEGGDWVRDSGDRR